MAVEDGTVVVLPDIAKGTDAFHMAVGASANDWWNERLAKTTGGKSAPETESRFRPGK